MSDMLMDMELNEGAAPAAPASEMDGKFLTFLTEGQVFAMPICNVLQILSIQDLTITAVPEFPFYAKGIINLRGSIVPIIDARLRMGKMEEEYTSHTCVIITSRGDRLVGCIVDAVDEVLAIEPQNISEPPKQYGIDVDNSLLTGMAKRDKSIILLINMNTFMGEF